MWMCAVMRMWLYARVLCSVAWRLYMYLGKAGAVNLKHLTMHNTMKHSTLYLIPVLAALPACLEAQITVSGTVIDATPKPVEYCNIRLFGDSLMVGGTVSNEKGKFSIDASAPGDYRLIVSAVGYRSDTLCLSGLDRSRRVGNIVLEEDEILLDSVTVTGRRIVRSIDRQSIYPNSLEKRTANNGAELLRNMSLPTLDIDVEQKSLKLTNGNAVEVRINGVPAKIEEIYAMDPSEILRIEYYDNSGVRLQNVGGIVDFIVKRRNSGGSIYTSAWHYLNTPQGNINLSGKLNSGKSEFKFGYVGDYCSDSRKYSDLYKEYRFPDGEVVTEQRSGIPSYSKYLSNNVYAAYNYTDVDRRVLNVYAGVLASGSDSESRYRTMYSDLPDYVFLSSEKGKDKPVDVSGDIFYKEYLSGGRNISVNASGYYVSSDSHSRLSDSNITSQGTAEFSNVTDISGFSYGISAKADYEKRTDRIVFYSGVKYNHSFSDNNYSGSTAYTSRIIRDDIYGYVRTDGRAGKFSYMAEAGVYGEFNNSDGETNRYFQFKGGIELAYNFSDRMRVSVSSAMRNTGVGMALLNDTERRTGRYVITKGNPSVGSSYAFLSTAAFSYSDRLWSLYFYFANNYVNKQRSFINSFDESRRLFVSQIHHYDYGMQNAVMSDLKINIIPDILSLNLCGILYWYKYKGFGHIYDKFTCYGEANLNFYMKGWTAYLSLASRSRFMDWNNLYSYQWPSDYMEVGYRLNDWYFAAFSRGLMFAGIEYNARVECSDWLMPYTLTEYNGKNPCIGLKVTWNVSWGRKSKNEQRNVRVNTESGIL